MSPPRRVEVDPATVGVLDPSLAVLSSPLVVLHCPLLVLAVLTSPTSPMVAAVVLVVVVDAKRVNGGALASSIPLSHPPNRSRSIWW